MNWKKVYDRMIDECMEQESKLNDWERNFLDSISDRLATEHPHLSENQIRKLEQIHEKIT